MTNNRLKLRYFAILMAISMGIQGCIDIEDYIDIVEKPSTDDAVEVVPPPGPKPDIPDQGEGDSNVPGGSDGVTPGPSGDDDPPGGNPGGVEDEKVLDFKSITPCRGDAAGGYEVRVRGSELSRNGTVYFGRVESPSMIYVNTRVVRAVVPPGNPGCVDVSWMQDGEQKTIKDGFCYVGEIVAETVVPSFAEHGATVPLTITGSGFDENTRAAFVSEDGTSLPLFDAKIVSDTEMTGMMPALPVGTASLVLTNSISKIELKNALTVLPALGVTDISPRVIPFGTSPKITLKGRGFTENTRLKIGGYEPGDIIADRESMTFTAPPVMPGSYDILVYDKSRQVRLDRAIHYYEDGAAPQILGVYPESGPSSGGTNVTVAGIGLPAGGDIRFDDQTATASSKNVTSWKAVTPSANPGMASVSVGELTLDAAFEFASYPECTGLSPKTGSAGTRVRLTGSGFDDKLRVFFGPFEASDVEIDNEGVAVASVPQGTGVVSVRLVRDNADITTNHTFTYQNDIEITGISTQEISESGGNIIEIYGSGFDNTLDLSVDGKKLQYVAASTNCIQFQAPGCIDGSVEIKLCQPNNECRSTEITCINANERNTGASGGFLDGTIYVTVLTTKTGDPIKGAKVYIGSDMAHAIIGTTDDAGRVTITDPSLRGAQTVIACASEHSCNTLQPVNARHITLFLTPFKNGMGQIEMPEPPPTPPDDGGTINPIEVPVEYTPKPAYYVGTVGDFGKIELESNPNHIRAGMVMQSALAPYVMPPYMDDINFLKEPGAEYRIRARKGDVALALICGIYDTESQNFYPKYIGIKRHQFAAEGRNVVNHLTCDLPLNQTQAIKMLDAPLKSGPNTVQAEGYIFIGNEGYIGGFMSGESKTDLVVVKNIPPLRGDLSESSIVFNVGAYTNGNYPATVINDVMSQASENGTIEVGPAVPIPVFKTKPTDDVLRNGKIAWSVEYPENVDFYELTVRMYSSERRGDIIYQFYLPGSATTAEFPMTVAWPEDHSGQIYIQLIAYKSVREGFDFNLFSTAELRYNYIHSSAYATIALREPGLNETP